MSKCGKCGECCKYLVFFIPPNLADTYRKYYEFRGCEIGKIERFNLEYIKVPNRCKHLAENNLCSIHKTKPKICKNFKGQEYYFVPENCSYRKK